MGTLMGDDSMNATLQAWPQPAMIMIMWEVGRAFCCCLEEQIQQMFWCGALSANTGSVVIMIPTPSVKTSKFIIAPGDEGVRGQWLVVV